MSQEGHRNTLTNKTLLKPSEYMRVWHPELFPDTTSQMVPILEKRFLEYQLDTLTSRKQEQVFEEFCRRLAELEICPNLKPQTGPTGGGDSGVDSSTYPVAPVLIERCYWGSPSPPSGEAWAFAFSCKKKWKEKMLDDVIKIAKMGRKFTKVFFISNQFIRDKTRSEVELELGKKYGFELHILDRTWIVNVVIEHKREEMAIELLGTSKAETRRTQLGPVDTSRQIDFDAVLKKIAQPELYLGNDYALAQDYLHAAKLARGLGKPRDEVDGLFFRARSLAQKCGYSGQIIRCGYHHAWTTFWWFDDASIFEKIYSEIESHLIGTADAEDCELFRNLWFLLFGAVKRGEIPPEQGKVDERLTNIRMEVNRLASEKDRPNNALHAETLSYLLQVHEALADESKARPMFDGLKRCLKRSVDLGTFPALDLINDLKKMGDVIGDLPGYDSLFDEMCQIMRARAGETSEGKLMLDRGMQLIEKGKPKDVLRFLGQSRVRLAKNETLKECIWAALGCSHAYMEMGLYWAARIEALIVAHTSLRTVESRYEFPLEGILATKLMGWLELGLGRIAPFIAWYQLSWLLVGELRSMQYDVRRFEDELRIQEGVLGCFFLNLDPEDVKELADLKQGLDQANLPMARWALLYALGETETLIEEVPQEMATAKDRLDEFFMKWRTQPAEEQLPKKLTGETRSYWNYETTVMSVSYHLKTRNYFGPIVFSENILGIIEAALALARWENLAFIVDEVHLLVDLNDSGNNPPKVDLAKPADPDGYKFIWRQDMLEWLNKTDRNQITEYLMQLLLKLLLDVTIDPLDDLKQELDRWHKEDAFSRALGTSPISIPLTDILGKKCYELSYWCNPSTPSKI